MLGKNDLNYCLAIFRDVIDVPVQKNVNFLPLLFFKKIIKKIFFKKEFLRSVHVHTWQGSAFRVTEARSQRRRRRHLALTVRASRRGGGCFAWLCDADDVLPPPRRHGNGAGRGHSGGPFFEPPHFFPDGESKMERRRR